MQNKFKCVMQEKQCLITNYQVSPDRFLIAPSIAASTSLSSQLNVEIYAMSKIIYGSVITFNSIVMIVS